MGDLKLGSRGTTQSVTWPRRRFLMQKDARPICPAGCNKILEMLETLNLEITSSSSLCVSFLCGPGSHKTIWEGPMGGAELTPTPLSRGSGDSLPAPGAAALKMRRSLIANLKLNAR